MDKKRMFSAIWSLLTSYNCRLPFLPIVVFVLCYEHVVSNRRAHMSTKGLKWEESVLWWVAVLFDFLISEVYKSHATLDLFSTCLTVKEGFIRRVYIWAGWGDNAFQYCSVLITSSGSETKKDEKVRTPREAPVTFLKGGSCVMVVGVEWRWKIKMVSTSF